MADELATLVLTIVSTLILPFLQRPILGYSNTYDELPKIDSIYSTELTVGITNYGLAPASDVVISFSSENSKFRGFSIEPAIPGSNTSYDIGHGTIEIENIAAGQHIEVNGYMDSSTAKVTKDGINLSVFS